MTTPDLSTWYIQMLEAGHTVLCLDETVVRPNVWFACDDIQACTKDLALL
jgi:hypothetical protein